MNLLTHRENPGESPLYTVIRTFCSLLTSQPYPLTLSRTSVSRQSLCRCCSTSKLEQFAAAKGHATAVISLALIWIPSAGALQVPALALFLLLVGCIC